ncbi:(2Fe-2S)-binding protein [Paenibacillus alba]|uniref:(2Fe-2S)-binding protein n=1 Tax=Paenibacillus alba TaxID=1197127 RepID=UPI00156407F8|nr:(2Fe-2S)-binding protein [Paenibacillus alba]NQX67484.1 (2Fe-2S)-binding protein [Paenibacillus alba]
MSSSLVHVIAEKFSVTTEFHPEPLFEIAGSRLSTEAGIEELVDAYSPLMLALEPAAAGVYFISRIAMLNGAMQYMVSHDELIDLAPELWTLQIYRHEKGYVEFRYVLSEIRWMEGPQSDQISLWREERLSHWYEAHIRPIVEATSRAVEVDLTHLWRLFPMRLRYMFDQLEEATSSEELLKRYEEDWTFLTKGLSGDPFGRSRNPLDVKINFVDYPGAPGEPDKQLRMKMACCMYYRTEGGNYCYTCPRMKPEERAERKEQLRVKLAEEAAAKIAVN